MEHLEVKFTIVNNEGEHLLTGCQGIYPSSLWRDVLPDDINRPDLFEDERIIRFRLQEVK